MYTSVHVYSKLNGFCKVAREEWRQQEQNHLRDKQQLGQQLHDKDKQYTQLIRDIKLKQMEQVRSKLGIAKYIKKNQF